MFSDKRKRIFLSSKYLILIPPDIVNNVDAFDSCTAFDTLLQNLLQNFFKISSKRQA